MILALRALQYTLMKRRLESIKLFSRYVQFFVEHQSRDHLAIAVGHDAGFAMIHCEAFFDCNHRDEQSEPIDHAPEVVIAGKHKVVGVTCVISVGPPSQSGQAAIQSISADVGNRRRSGRQFVSENENSPLIRCQISGLFEVSIHPSF